MDREAFPALNHGIRALPKSSSIGPRAHNQHTNNTPTTQTTITSIQRKTKQTRPLSVCLFLRLFGSHRQRSTGHLRRITPVDRRRTSPRSGALIYYSIQPLYCFGIRRTQGERKNETYFVMSTGGRGERYRSSNARKASLSSCIIVLLDCFAAALVYVWGRAFQNGI